MSEAGASSRRVLITGISSPVAGRLAQALERERGVEAIVGVDAEEPRHELQRTEFVRLDLEPTLLRRILAAAAIDTVIDTRLVVDPLAMPLSRAREVNLAGTRKLLAGCADPDSPVRKLLFTSSAQVYGSEPSDPQFISEAAAPQRPPRTELERDLLEAEAAVAEFATARPRAVVTVLRFADALGSELRSSMQSLLGLPVVPAVLGFDPRCQFVHQEDIVGALAFAAARELPGTYNVAADGVLALSEVVSLLGKPLLPILPPWGTVFAAAQLRRLGLTVPLELLRQLRAGRGFDNRRLKASGFAYRYTTRETVLKLRAHQRLRPLLGSGEESYRYEREVEEFLRWSPSVRQAAARRQDSGPELADLEEPELLELIGSLELDALRRLREWERAGAARPVVLAELDRRLALPGARGAGG